MKKSLLFAWIGLSVLIPPANLQGQDCTINTPDGTVLNCAVMQLVLQANPQDDGFTYSWTDSEGTVISMDVPANIDEAGMYTLTVMDEDTSCVGTIEIEEDRNLPDASIASSGPLCQGGTITLTASGGETYRWDNNTTNPNRTVSSPDTYTVTVTGSNGCQDDASIDITELPTPNASIAPSGPLCQGGIITLMASGGGTYQWDNNTTNPNRTVSSPGTYTVIVTGSNGCQDDASIDITELPTPNASIAPSGPLCQGGTITLMASAPGGANYQWNGGIDGPNRDVSSPGTYSVTVTGSNGCKDDASIDIEEVPRPTVSITGNEPLCEGGSLTLQASSTPSNVSYKWEKQEEGDTWTPTGNSASLPTGFLETNTTYRVTVRESICELEASDAVTVTVFPQPNPSIEGPTEVCKGQRIIYSVKDDPSVVGVSRITWELPTGVNIDTLFSKGAAAVVTWNNDSGGELSVKVELGSCMDTASLPVTISNSATTANADAEIRRYDINNIMIANDPSATCYQWGYYDPSIPGVVELPGETYQAYAPGEAFLASRSYFVKTWSGDCSVESCANVIYFLAPSISEPAVEARLQLYPNPNSGLFLFQAEGLKEQPYQLRVADVMGRTLWENTVTADGGKIEEAVVLNERVTGLHTLLIVSEKGDWHKALPFLLHNW